MRAYLVARPAAVPTVDTVHEAVPPAVAGVDARLPTAREARQDLGRFSRHGLLHHVQRYTLHLITNRIACGLSNTTMPHGSRMVSFVGPVKAI